MSRIIRHLALPKSGKIKQVIHCSDIHIRKGDSTKSRYNEYAKVFEQFAKQVQQLPSILNGEAVIVVAGDIFHDKENLHPLTIRMFNLFLNQLVSLAPVYLIQGNHDFRQDNASETDTIDSCIGIKRPNLEYLEQTGLYLAGDVGFGLVAEHDILDPCTTSGKQVDELPLFPNEFPPSVTTRLAIFHGTVKNCRLDNYRPSNEGYPLEWFKGYDAVLLGHIHLQQIYNTSSQDQGKTERWQPNKTVWAYPGSLVQQNFGENLHGHGYLVWDLKGHTVEPYHVYNDYGMMYVKFDKSSQSWSAKLNGAYHDLADTLALPLIPKERLLIKIEGRRTRESGELLLDILTRTLGKEHYVIVNELLDHIDIETSYDIDPENLVENSLLSYLGEINSLDMFIEYIENNVENVSDEYKLWLKSPELMLIDQKEVPKSIVDKVSDRNEKISKQIKEFNKKINQIQDSLTRGSLKLLHLEWEWMISYGKDCWFDFQQMEGKIGIVDGPNDAGKSSLMEIICLAIFGQGIKSRQNKSFSSSIVCFQKPTGESSKTTLRFELGNQIYVLTRKYADKGNNKLQVKNQELYTETNGRTEKYKTGSNAVETWVKDNIGDIDTFLLSCMLTQNLDQDFFAMSDKEQINMIDRALNLGYISSLQNLFKEVNNGYSYVIGHINTVYKQMANNQTQFDEQAIATKRQQQDNLQKQINQIEERLLNIESKTGTIPNGASSDLQMTIDALKLKLKESNGHLLEIECPDRSLEELIQNKGEISAKLRPIQNRVTDELGRDIKTLERALQNLTKVDRPSGNEEELLESIHSFEKRWDQPKMERRLSNLSNYLAKETTIRTKLSTNKSELNQHLNDFPVRPTEDKQSHTEWQKKNREFAKFTNDNYQALLDFCQNHPLIKPTMDASEIERLKTSLQKAKKTLKKTEWFDCDQELFKKENQVVLDEWERINKEYDQKNSEKDTLEKQLASIFDQESTLEKSIKMLEHTNKPEIGQDEVKQWLDKYERLKKSQSTYQRIHHLETELQELTQRLEQIEKQIKNAQEESKKLSFNPDCWACQKQPWKLHLDSLIERQTETRKAIELQKEQICLMRKKTKTEDGLSVINAINSFSEMKNKSDIYQQYLRNHQKYDQFISKFEPLNRKLEVAKDQRKGVMESINRIKKETTDLKQKIQQLSGQHREVKYCEDNRDGWINNSRMLKQQETLQEKYSVCREKHEQLENYQRYLKEKDCWTEELKRITEFEAWELTKAQLSSSVKDLESLQELLKQKIARCYQYQAENLQYQNSLKSSQKFKEWHQFTESKEKYQATIYHCQLTHIDAQINTWKIFKDLTEKTNYWKQLATIKPQLDEKQQLKDSLTQDKLDLSALTGELARMEHQMETCREESQTRELVIEQLNQLDTKKNTVNTIFSLIDGYKQWLYRNKLIPKIIKDTNRLAHLITSGQEYELQADVSDDGHIAWFMSDGVNRPVIEKSGGFRKYLYGLAIRIALSYLGGNSVMCRQIFFDEGFVHADTNNLELVPDFLRNILKLYDSILVVSHLEILKNAGDISITIARNNKLSSINFGNRNKPTLKQVGRPKTIVKNEQESSLDLDQGKVKNLTPAKIEPKSTRDDPTIDKNSTTKNEKPAIHAKIDLRPDEAKQTVTTEKNPNKCKASKSDGNPCPFNKKYGDYCGRHRTPK
jgi:exonuclease SbcC